MAWEGLQIMNRWNVKTHHVCTPPKGGRKFTSQKSHKISPSYDGYNTSAHVWLGMEQYKDFGNGCTEDKSSMELHYAAKEFLGRLWTGQYLCIQCCFTHFCSPH